MKSKKSTIKKRNNSIKKRNNSIKKRNNSIKIIKTRTPYYYMSFMDSEENRLLEKIHNCKTKHCSKELDEKSKYGVIYEKAHDIACPPNMKDEAFQKCDSDFYDKSDYKKYSDNISKCNKKHCDKYGKAYRKYHDKIIFKQLNIPQTIGNMIVAK